MTALCTLAAFILMAFGIYVAVFSLIVGPDCLTNYDNK